MRGIAV
jgi:hypothetical protein